MAMARDSLPLGTDDHDRDGFWNEFLNDLHLLADP
jgi:hypothetical protein